MPKLTMIKPPVRKEQEQEDRSERAPVLLAALSRGLLRRLGSAGRGYALAGVGVVAAAVAAVSLLSWLAPDSDRPIANPLEAVGRAAGEVIEQVDDRVEALLGTAGENIVLRSVRDGLAAAGSVTPWPSAKTIGGESSPFATGPPSVNSSSSEAPTHDGESSSDSEGAPTTTQPTSSSAPSGLSEAPASTDAPSSPTTSEPAPPASEEPPVAEDPSTPTDTEEPPAAEKPPPPTAEEPPPATEEPPVAEEPTPPPAEEPPPPSTEEPAPPAASDPPPSEGPPGTIADE